MPRTKQYREVITLMEKYKITLECLCKYTVTIDGKRYYVSKTLRKGSLKALNSDLDSQKKWTDNLETKVKELEEENKSLWERVKLLSSEVHND